MIITSFFPSFVQVVVGICCLYCVHRTYWELTTGRRHRHIIAKHGCKPPKTRHANGIRGIAFLFEGIRSIREHKGLETYERRFKDLSCTTFFTRFLNLKMFLTIEPENIKSILATDFKSYSLGEERKKGLRPILGDGIFVVDGAEWQHSREMLRPSFVRSQIRDTALFEKHFKHLLSAIPRDGSTVDLQGLFFKLSLDIATEFLFGQSTYTLAPGKSRQEDEEFVKAFTYVQNVVAPLEGKSSIWSIFLPNLRYGRDCKFIHRT